MIRIEREHVFPVAAETAFAFITDTKNWPLYWPDYIRLDEWGKTSWGSPGAMLTVVIRLLMRETALSIKLHTFEKNALVKYVSHQKGLPVIRHERHFISRPSGSVFRLVMEYKPRSGVKGLFDRLILKRSIEKAVTKTLSNLDALLK